MSIKFEDVVLPSAEQWRAIIIGARNPMNSWDKSDSYQEMLYVDQNGDENYAADITIGPNDLDLMKRLRNAGTDHRKFMRMIPVIVTITAPLYWWKEFDTYKVGTVANSCSTMHKIAAKEFTLEDFSCEHLITSYDSDHYESDYRWHSESANIELYASPLDGLILIVGLLNANRKAYLKTKDKKYWWQMIQLLPSSYNQKRTVMLNYEVLANIYKSRKDHKLDEWAETKLVGDHPANMYPNKFTDGFCDWIKTLPYSELITGDFNKEEK